MKTVPIEIERIFKKVKANLQKAYGKRLKGTILYQVAFKWLLSIDVIANECEAIST